MGFQRSLALTAHLAVHGEIITQATALKDINFLARPPEPGSWKLVIAMVGGMVGVGTYKPESPVGHAIMSLYDYAVYRAYGVPLDMDRPLREHYEDAMEKGAPGFAIPTDAKVDSLIEKCEVAYQEIHRPILFSETARSARIVAYPNQSVSGKMLGPVLGFETHEKLSFSEFSPQPELIEGIIASYNSNTFKGRIFSSSEGRPIPFELDGNCRKLPDVRSVTESLSIGASRQGADESKITVKAIVERGRSGRVRSYRIVEILSYEVLEDFD